MPKDPRDKPRAICYLGGMKTFHIFYRVPANSAHGSYLSETTIEATDKING